MSNWHLVALKREQVPNWLYRIFCIRLPVVGQVSLIFPFRQILHRVLTRDELIERS